MNTMIYRSAVGLLSAFALLAGCSQNPGAMGKADSKIEPQAFLGTPPADPQTELAQLSRYIGQTRFLNPSHSYLGHPSQRDGAQESAQSEAREEQESDVYKVGKEGSKLLFLLNNYRGLQVISYANGPSQPEIIGRVPATGKFSDDMYYDESRDRIVVLERDWQAQSENKSRLVIYNVSNPAEPSIAHTQSILGTYVDSRIVGDVLYVATRTEEKGAVLSYDLTKDYLPVVDQRELSQQVSYQENMNIIEVKDGESYKYYLVSVLTDSNWGWWDRQSTIEVIDISSPEGRIVPLMLASAKGRVQERSQTTIKDHTLIVTSNYQIEGEERIFRVAVESFVLPQENAEVISEDEAQYRKLAIERKLRGMSGEAKETKREELLKDAELGLIGRFVKSNGTLKKLFADSSVTVGDTTGLSASLQDVRYSGDLLYAFWVPANMVDPFDLFDISNPQEGINYLGRLQFDGWIERAIPLEVEGRQFVLGLGWLVPNVDNENGRRVPQAKIFEIMDLRGELRAIDVASIDLQDARIYTNFNTADKNIEVTFTAEGQGRVLFQASRYTEDNYQSGGQIINFDLQALLANDTKTSLTQGAFLAGESSWVRRVFTNPSINRINSFSDRALATFEEGDAQAQGTLSPESILELARNIRAYETLKNSEGQVGVQLISDYSWYGSSEKSVTHLRSVATDRADTEKPNVFSEVQLEGNYLGHMVVSEGRELLVLTNLFERVTTDESGYSYKTTNYVHRIGLAEQKLAVQAKVNWEHTRENDIHPIGLMSESMPMYYGSSATLIQLPDGRILAQANSSLKWIELSAGIQAITPQFESCTLQGRSDVQVQVLGEESYLTSSEVFASTKYEGLQLRRNFASPLAGEGGSLVCAGERNVPGELVGKEGQFLLTDDTWASDVVAKKVEGPNGEIHTYHQTINKQSLSLVELAAERKAVLVDEKPDKGSNGRMKMTAGSLVEINKAGYDEATLDIISIAKEGRILEDSYHLRHDLSGTPRLQKLVDLVQSDDYLAVIGSGDELQVLRFSKESPRPVVEQVALVGTDFEMEKSQEKIMIPGSYYSYYSSSDEIHYTEEQGSFEISKGLSGIIQIFLADQPDSEE